MKNHRYLLLILLVIFFSGFFVLRIPFFYDMIQRSLIANYIFENNFSSIIYPNRDNGLSPLYSLYIALAWKLFFKNLAISHWAFLPIYIGLIYQFYKLCLNFVHKNASIIATILISFSPIFFTQYILMGYDIISVFFFLLAVYSLLNKNNKLLILSTIIISLIHIRGFSIVISLYLIDLYINSSYLYIKKILKSSLKYTPSLIAVSSWLIYHYSQMNWFAVNNAYDSIHNYSSFTWVLKNVIFNLFAFMSNGRVFIIILSILLFIYLKRIKTKINNNLLNLVIITLLTILPYAIIFIPLSYAVSPRHYMTAYPFLYIIFILLVYHIKNKKIRLSLSISLLLLMFSSNFYVNPYPYANSWDSNLKALSYLNSQHKLIKHIKDKKISPEKVYVEFPLTFNFKDAYVNDSLDIQFKEYKKESKIIKGDYFLLSRVYNSTLLSNPNFQINNSRIEFKSEDKISKLILYIKE